MRLHVGVIPNREVSWNPLLICYLSGSILGIRGMLAWGNVVLLNYVLNVILIFYLSFLKMSVKVWRKIVQIQWGFLWGGAKANSKISWVSLVDVCKPKSKGGLGVSDLRLVNLVILVEWRWRLILGAFGLWRYIFLACYDASIVSSGRGGNNFGFQNSSPWWKEASLLSSK